MPKTLSKSYKKLNPTTLSVTSYTCTHVKMLILVRRLPENFHMFHYIMIAWWCFCNIWKFMSLLNTPASALSTGIYHHYFY